MGRPNFDQQGNEIPPGVMEFVGKLCDFLTWAGGVASVASFGLLILIIQHFSSVGGTPSSADVTQAVANIGSLSTILQFALIAFGVGSAVRWWGETHLPIIQILVALVVVLAPQYVPLIFPTPTASQVTPEAYQAFQTAGSIFAVLAAIVVTIDIVQRIRDRIAYGIKAEQLKFGKGIKEESGAQNVFMGKCWQLPYCRKFVRERCPIYHAKKACWREKVGCMCEEEVIRSAMENRAIPKDAVLASKFIPVNNRLTLMQKIQRCKQCVIYNEHQKHKYKLWLAVLNVSYLALVAAFWKPLNELAGVFIKSVENVYTRASFHNSGLEAVMNGSVPFTAILLIAVVLIFWTYLLKTLEYLIFKLKI